MKKISVCILLVFLLISSCHKSNKTIENDVNNNKELEITFPEINDLNIDEQSEPDKTGNEEENQIVEYYTTPNGTMVDTRIPQNIADNIIRRLNAIENGDLTAFRATFEGHDFQDGAGTKMHMWFVGTFFGDIIGFNWDNYDDSIEEYNKVFHDEFPPQKRNMWASIEKIEIIDISDTFGVEAGNVFGIRVDILNYEDKVLNYYLGIDLLPSEKYFIGGEIMYLRFLLRDNPCCLMSDGGVSKF